MTWGEISPSFARALLFLPLSPLSCRVSLKSLFPHLTQPDTRPHRFLSLSCPPVPLVLITPRLQPSPGRAPFSAAQSRSPGLGNASATTLAWAWRCCLNAIQATRCTAPLPSGVRPCPMPWPSGTAPCPHVSVSVLIFLKLVLSLASKHERARTHTHLPLKGKEQVHKSDWCLGLFVVVFFWSLLILMPVTSCKAFSYFGPHGSHTNTHKGNGLINGEYAEACSGFWIKHLRST